MATGTAALVTLPAGGILGGLMATFATRRRVKAGSSTPGTGAG